MTTTRRDFLRSTVATLAVAAVPSWAVAAPPEDPCNFVDFGKRDVRTLAPTLVVAQGEWWIDWRDPNNRSWAAQGMAVHMDRTNDFFPMRGDK